jgi:hypothetical protein
MLKKLAALVILSASLNVNADVFETHSVKNVPVVALSSQEVSVINELVAQRVSKNASEEEVSEVTAQVVNELFNTPATGFAAWSTEKKALAGAVAVVVVSGVAYLVYTKFIKKGETAEEKTTRLEKAKKDTAEALDKHLEEVAKAKKDEKADAKADQKKADADADAKKEKADDKN